MFKDRFVAERLPHRNCVSALLDKFKRTCSVQGKSRLVRPRVAIERVLQDVSITIEKSQET